MKRNAFTKIVAWLLCAMLLVSCVPMAALAEDWEGEMDVMATPGSEENPIEVIFDEWGYASVIIPAGETYYFYNTSNMAEMTLTADGEVVDSFVVGNRWMAIPNTWNITNNYEEEYEFYLYASLPLGHQGNPDMLWLDTDVPFTIAEGALSEYFLTYTAEATGKLYIEISSADGNWRYTVDNLTTSKYGDPMFSDDDPVVNPYAIDVTEGDEIVVRAITYNPEDPYTAPEGELTVKAYYAPGSSAAAAIQLEGAVNTVNVSGTVYYAGQWAGCGVVISGEGDFSVISEGETIPAVDGKVELSFPVPMGYPFPNVIAIVGEGEYTITANIPVGTDRNPDTAVLGDNVATFEAGATSEYFWNYTAEKDGELNIAVSSQDGNWQYTVNNLTTFVYGDTQWSDSDPVVNPTTITVAAGDLIQIKVITYNPENEWVAPAGVITTNLAYTEEGPTFDANLVFTQTGLSFQEFIGIQPAMKYTVASGYDRVYIEVTHVTWDRNIGDFATVTEEIEGSRYLTSNVFRFTKKIMAWGMTEAVSITLYAEKDGVLYVGQSVDTSVTALAVEKIAQYEAAGKATACTALANMLKYGAAVQTQYSHNSENLPTAQLGAYSKYVTTAAPTITASNSNTGSGIKVNLNSVSMQAQVEIQFGFKNTVDLTGYEIRYTVDGVTETIPVEEFGTVGSYNVAKIAIKASNMRKNYTVALYDSATGKPASAVYTVSVEAYAKAKVSSAQELIYALMNYGDAIAAL